MENLSKNMNIKDTFNDSFPCREVYVSEVKLCMVLVEHNFGFAAIDHLPKAIEIICPDSNIAPKLKCARTKATGIINNSVIIDETTDVSVSKCLAVRVRYFCEERKRITCRGGVVGRFY